MRLLDFLFLLWGDFCRGFRAQPRHEGEAWAPTDAGVWAPTVEQEFQHIDYVEIGQVYAGYGECVCCERGHRIGFFARTVHTGDPWDDKALQFFDQRQKPTRGMFEWPCLRCGARWFKGPYLHFAGGWRVAAGKVRETT